MTTRLPIYPADKARRDKSPTRSVEITIDGQKTLVPEGATLLEAIRSLGIDTPTLCFAENLTPVNVCRVCVVELEGSRTLVPSCSRKAEPGMVVKTDSERVRTSRKVVIELLVSSVDMSQTPGFAEWLDRYGADPERFGPDARTKAQPTKEDNELFARDYDKCILCYKCVEACGDDAQNTFAIAVAGRGFDARISTELDVPLPDSACVFCGNCVGVCPTNALVFSTELEMRRSGSWDESRQTKSTTVCPYCGVGCAVTLHVQDGKIFKATSPVESTVTEGHLCVKGRFGWQYVGSK
ncbi:MAG: (2Fe-2S)-binding protein [Myxococcales bacterium]|nr:(2Fe-2S)-binding protein [Myxococcales bacterium]